MSRGKDDSARADELKLEEFLDFVARMIARRWIQEQRVQDQESATEPDGSKSHSNSPMSEPDA